MYNIKKFCTVLTVHLNVLYGFLPSTALTDLRTSYARTRHRDTYKIFMVPYPPQKIYIYNHHPQFGMHKMATLWKNTSTLSKHPSILVFLTTIYNNPGHGGILKKYLDKSKHLSCLRQSAGAGAFALFLSFGARMLTPIFFNFTPGLLPIFEFWGTPQPPFFNFGPGGFAPVPGTGTHISLRMVKDWPKHVGEF